MSKPKKEETSNKITHTEETDADCASRKHNDEGDPEHILEQARLQVVQIGAKTK